MLRTLTLSLIALAPCSLLAESALFTPFATVLQPKAIEYKDFYAPGHKSNEYIAVSIGIGNHMEFGYTAPRFNDREYTSTWGLEYNLISPRIDSRPALAIGVSDATNLTGNGRRGYAVATFEFSVPYALKQKFFGQTSIGYLAGKRSTPFVNAKLPLGENLAYIVEYDGDEINTGFDFLAYKGITLRAAMKGNTALLGIKLHYQF